MWTRVFVGQLGWCTRTGRESASAARNRARAIRLAAVAIHKIAVVALFPTLKQPVGADRSFPAIGFTTVAIHEIAVVTFLIEAYEAVAALQTSAGCVVAFCSSTRRREQR